MDGSVVWTTRTRGVLIERPVRSCGESIGSSSELPGRSVMSARRRGARRRVATAHATSTVAPQARMDERCIGKLLCQRVRKCETASGAAARPGQADWCAIACPSRGIPGESRRRRRQDLLVLALVLRLAHLRREDQQVVLHLTLRKRLSELGDELALLEVAVEELELLEVLRRGLADKVAARALFAVLLEPLLDHLVCLLRLLR